MRLLQNNYFIRNLAIIDIWNEENIFDYLFDKHSLCK